ncbi:MAG: hypothetical protein R3E63_08120 [Pseudomonadales bacterium]
MPPAVDAIPASSWKARASEGNALDGFGSSRITTIQQAAIDLTVGVEGCTGAVTLHGVPSE